jgi:transposase
MADKKREKRSEKQKEKRIQRRRKRREKRRWKLTDERWARIEPYLPKLKKSEKGGRPPIDNRTVFEGILWILRTGAPWGDLPEKYSSGSTCWRRLQQWEEDDVWVKAWRALLGELDGREQLDWSECFIDGSFAPAKKGANASGRRNAARARSGWWWLTAKEFLWGTTWTLRPRTRSRSSRRRLRR